MNRIVIPQYDYGYQEQITLFTDSTHAEIKDLEDTTVSLKMWGDDPTTPVFTETCVIDNVSKTIFVPVTAEMTAKVGFFNAELELTKSGMKMSSVPFEISIVESAQ